jgi:two-component system sensor histidine kinase SenX3
MNLALIVATTALAFALGLVLLLVRRRSVAAVDAASARIAGLESALEAAAVHERRIAGALESVHDGVVIADPQRNVVFRNSVAGRYHGARRSEAVAEDLLERLLEQALSGEPVVQEISLFGPPRSTLVLRAVPLERDGVALGAVAIVRDVTDLRRIEQVRRDFVANVSHELKTPIGALELLAETVSSSDDPAVQRRLADQLVVEADRLARIVDDLLDLSLIEAEETPTRERLLVRVLVEEAVERVRALALARGIALRVAPISDSLVVSCDATRVVGAVMNLLDNAVKYSDDGAAVDVRADVDGDRVVIEVEDQGIGIPASELERVFERFYRVDKARSRATGGTGLGLSIVRHVAHAHGGEVMVTSREGVGSIFRFSLPNAEVSPRSAGLATEAV